MSTLRRDDQLLIAGLALSYGLVALLSLIFIPALSLMILMGWGFCVLTALLILHSRRATVLLKKIQQKQTRDFRHLQSLFSLFNLVRFNAPLPVMRGWSVMPDFCNVLLHLIQELQPQTIVEAGSGISTVVAGTVVRQMGIPASIYSLEHDADFFPVSQTFIRQHHLQNIVRLILAPLKNIAIHHREYLWYDLQDVTLPSKIDLLIVDGPPANLHEKSRYPALPLLLERLSDRAAILMDDGQRERHIAEQWVQEYPAFHMEIIPTEQGAIILRNYSPDTLLNRNADFSESLSGSLLSP